MSKVFISPDCPTCGNPLEAILHFPSVVIQDVENFPIPEGIYFVNEEAFRRENFPVSVIEEFDQFTRTREPELGYDFMRRDGETIWKITKVEDRRLKSKWAYSRITDSTTGVIEATNELINYFEQIRKDCDAGAGTCFKGLGVDVDEMINTSMFGKVGPGIKRNRRCLFFNFDGRFPGLPVSFAFWDTYQDETSDGFHDRKAYVGLTGRIMNDKGRLYSGSSHLGVQSPLYEASGGQRFPVALLTYTGVLNPLIPCPE